MIQWYSVDESLPEETGEDNIYLVTSDRAGERLMQTAILTDYSKWISWPNGWDIYGVDHWADFNWPEDTDVVVDEWWD